ncbi:hypothetical protein LP419_18935 [Massilia sp. H-1]|nr:hypothetical protein LP419_18935 [Massilia sp. H-1]
MKIPAAELGAHVIKHLVAQIGLDPASINEVIMGQVLTCRRRPGPCAPGRHQGWPAGHGA